MDYSDSKTAQAESTLGSLIEGISTSRSRIEDNASKVYSQLERLGFYKPVAQPTALGGAINGVATPRERTALEALEYQAICLRNEADRLESIAHLLNTQF